jgi:drug/metabolite transporter (DMT)-like permease
MRRFYLAGFIVLAGFDTLAQVCFKFAGSTALPLEANMGWVFRVVGQPYVYGAILGYVGAFLTWMSLLRHAPVGPAFAATHLHVVTVLLVSAWFFGEPLTAMRLSGAGLILAGIICLGFAEQALDKSGTHT